MPDLLGLDERMTPAGAHLLAHVCAEATPVRVSGDAQYLINRTARGWVVTLFNNRGVEKPPQGMAQVDRAASVHVTINLREGSIGQAREWTVGAPLERAGEDRIGVTIPPGGVRVVELVEAAVANRATHAAR